MILSHFQNLNNSCLEQKCASLLFLICSIESGMSAVTLSLILGHNNIQITLDTYTDVFNNLKIDELKKLENYINKI